MPDPEPPMSEMPLPAEQEERRQAWMSGHPIWETLSIWDRRMTDLDDEQSDLAPREVTLLTAATRDDLLAFGLPTSLIDQVLTPRIVPSTAVPGETLRLWSTTAEQDDLIREALRAEWESIPQETKDDAWNPATGGTGYFEAVERVRTGLPR